MPWNDGVEVTELGVKDLIPGEIRELVSKVVEPERVAKANQPDPPPAVWQEGVAHARPFTTLHAGLALVSRSTGFAKLGIRFEVTRFGQAAARNMTS